MDRLYETESKYSSREAQALAEIGRTTIRPVMARLLTVVFLGLIGAASLVQQATGIRDCRAGRRASVLPQCCDVFRSPPGAAPALTQKGMPLVQRIIAANRSLMRAMRAYEDQLEDNSVVGGWVRAPTQYILTRWLGAGNDKTYCGRGQWLFYRPDVDCVIGQGFLKPEIMARRAASAGETRTAPQPDPRQAIIEFNTELAARGIRLILMPTPVKPVVQPGKFAAGFEGFYKPLHNASYHEFVRDLEKEGILVFDAAEALVRNKRQDGKDQFLARDTHWRPEAMEHCARLLSGFIKKNVALTPVPAPGYTAVRTNIIQRGDIAVMLCLPAGAKGYGPENVEIRRIFEPDGRSWRPAPESEALVLGDSFCNIYSLETMGWGANAGLVEQLSYEMGGKIDRLAANDNGAWASRELLRKEIWRGSNRLAGKRVVVWQFAERELSEGDWKILPLDVAVKPTTFIKLEPGSQLVVCGRIEKIAKAPRPRAVPYADHIIAAHLVDVREGANQRGQALVYLFSMTNNALTSAAGLKAGDMVELKLFPWSDISVKYERINRADLDDPELLSQEPCWGELAPESK